MIKIFGKYRYHWQPELSWLIIYWSLAITPIFIAGVLLFELYSVPSHILMLFTIFVALFGLGFHRYFIIEDYGIKYMVYNLEGLSSIDSVGENALLSGGKSVKENDGRVLLINNKVNTCLRFDKITDELVALDLLKI